MSSCSWLAWFRRELMQDDQDACRARCLTFSTDGVLPKFIRSNFGSMSPHLIPRIMLGVILFQMWKRTLSTFPSMPPSLCNATWVHCGACADINITYNQQKQLPEVRTLAILAD